ncbi:phasin family protein [Paenibacillus nasutitermitis]|uniref:ATP synthase subunit B n=1 Tax=Paenibacillus nasutitermitis TaxID=1652958 RepID=A0A917DT32_9BACL|nr:polyhydroxyalkanoate synthesis regulator [Paenibacillus nasutitermitis]GGD64533.1 ATP synthase subunit B [Paenibacillus nasutitermitis]
MNEIIKKALSLGVGITITSKEKVEKVVEELVKKGEIAPGESKELLNRLIQRGEDEQTELKRIVREQLQQLLVELNVATKDDIIRLETQIKTLKTGPAEPLELNLEQQQEGQA